MSIAALIAVISLAPSALAATVALSLARVSGSADEIAGRAADSAAAVA